MNYLREKVDNLSKKMIETYNTTIVVESSVYSDFPYMALSFLRTNYNEIYQLVISHIFPDDSGRTNYLLYNYNDTVITRLFLAAEDYLTLSGRDTSRWITETSFLIKEKEYYISNQWVGHTTEHKKNLRINDFAIAIYESTNKRFFVNFVKKDNSKNFVTQLIMIEREKEAKIEMDEKQTFDIKDVISRIKSTGLIFSDKLIKRLAYSLMAKPFVILSGLAGSGKTQLALAFAKCLSENIKEQVCTVSVGADWTNREPLLGYPNALNDKEYVLPESGALQLLIRAKANPQKPFFLILDEMNLSVVERYFADFLSAMESGEDIQLWNSKEENKDEHKSVPSAVSLLKNVFIIGTINVDETTYMFSPKVLDRANVIEFKVSYEEMEKYLLEKKDIHLDIAYSACANMAIDFVEKAKTQVLAEENSYRIDILMSFFKELKKVNAEFGYRTVNEISRYLHFVGDELGDKGSMDTAILQKLMPKLHGSRKKLEPVLGQLWKLCFTGAGKDLPINQENVEKAEYKESADKIRRMFESANANGFTSFAEA